MTPPRRIACLVGSLLILSAFSRAPAQQAGKPPGSPQSRIEAAAALIASAADRGTRYDYVVTAAVRIVFLWLSRDDIGQGYIRIARSESRSTRESISLLMGSDPAKAPMSINRWGAACEVSDPEEGTGAFFAFMKASKGQSVDAMKTELGREKEGSLHQFEGIISHRNGGEIVSTAVPIGSPVDFTLHQLPQATQMVMESLKECGRPPRCLNMTPEAEGKGASGFLFTLHDLIQAALAGRTPPISRSYVYHARTYTMTLKECRTIPQLKVSVKLHEGKGKIEKSYPRVNAARFQTVNSDTGERTDFRVAFASSGELKGVPVQVEYQPNWWFKVILNLNPAGAR